MDDLLSEFLTETAESLDVIDTELVRFESQPEDKATLNNIFRLVHTIKGTCGFIGLPRLESIAHAGETLLGKFRDGALPVTPAAVSLGPAEFRGHRLGRWVAETALAASPLAGAWREGG